MSISERFEPAICNYCGEYIEEPHHQCPARDEGRFRP